MSTNDEGESPLVRNMWETAIFGFTVTALVFSVPGNLPGIWEGPEKTPANFLYGAPQCVESLLRSTGIDIRDNEQLIQPGFHEPKYASPKKYDSFMYKFGKSLPIGTLDCTGAAAEACLDHGHDAGFHYDFDTPGNCGDGDAGETLANWPQGQVDVVLGDNALDAAAVTAAADCDKIYPKPIFTSGPTQTRIFHDRLWQESQDRHGSTTTLAPLVTAATATTARTTRPATRPTFTNDQTNIVFNAYHSQSLSPYLDADKENNRCEGILRKMRDRVSNDNWDFFDQQNIGDLMMCNIVYGWSLGEYCASALDEENLHLLGVEPTPDDGDADNTALKTAFDAVTAKERSDARAICQNATRTTCGNHYAGDAAGGVTKRNNENGNKGITAAGTPLFMAAAGEQGATAMIAGLKEKPCFMKSGYGRSPVNSGRLFGNFMLTKGTEGPIMPGSEMSPSVMEAFFDDLKHGVGGSAADKTGFEPNHFVDIGLTTEATADQMAITVDGDPRVGFTNYNTRQSGLADDGGTNGAVGGYSDDLIDGETAFARVNVPVTGIDSRYIYERLVYDFLVLAQMADKIDREEDFYNMLPAECFSDGSGSSVRAGTRFTWTVFLVTLLLFLLPRFPGISSLTEDYEYTLPLPRTGQIISEATHTKIVFLLSMIVGILGFSISMAINPDGPGARDGEVSGLQSWAAVIDSHGAAANADRGILPDAGNFFQNENTDTVHRTFMFLNDLSNGNYHRAYGLDEDE